jgi:hypothetical protein
MKTIIVVFTKTKINEDLIYKLKQYTFNTESDIKKGDLITIDGYNSNLQVTGVFEKLYKSYSNITGQLFEELEGESYPAIKVVTCKVIES